MLERSRGLALLVALVVAIAVALSVVGTGAPRVAIPSSPYRQAAVQRPDEPPPPVEPLLLRSETPEQAQASNAALPIDGGAPTPARPFRFAGATADRDAARACLAAAAWYEAGDDAVGERAVAQVVLNRLRHPAFPKTVCGVVLQGSERRTGCQFTFTCDGSFARVPSAAAWERAEAIAGAALSGKVDKSVGSATHYHADYVVPYWRDTLRKIAVVGRHIFYRWPGWWGSTAALDRRPAEGERPDPHIARLAGLAPLLAYEDDPDAPPAQSLTVAGVPQATLNGSVVRLKDEDGGQFVLELGSKASPHSFVITAFNLCGDRENCTVLGWASGTPMPRAFPIPPAQLHNLAFFYRRSVALGTAQSFWDCDRYPRPLSSQCLMGPSSR